MRRLMTLICLPLLFAAPSFAQEAAEPPSEVSERMLRIEQELADLKAEMADLEAQQETAAEPTLGGWQLQIRGGWFNLAHNHRDNVFSADDHQNGWTVGMGLMVPLWRDLGPIDLYASLWIEFRQIAYSPEFTAPITGEKGTANYLNIIWAPCIRFPVSDALTPFAIVGLDFQVSSPPQDAITYLDMGAVLGLGCDFKVHERVSVGADYRYSWFGVGDQEEEDYGVLSGYIGFNF